jgi:putative hemolysin
MKKNKYSHQLFTLLALILLSTACAVLPANSMDLAGNQKNVTGMANPSAVYCEGLGYPYKSVERNGGMDADCILPDSSRCTAWDFLSGGCGQEFTYCELNGGTIEEGANIGTCRFVDGSSCDEYQYFLGECSPGEQPGEISEVDLNGEEEDVYPVEEETIKIKISPRLEIF